MSGRVQVLVDEGNQAFDQMHLVGWRKAEERYTKALRLGAGQAVQDRLELTRYLVLTREIEEKIIRPDQTRQLQTLCSEESPARHGVLCMAAKTTFRLGGLVAGEPPSLPPSALTGLEQLRDGSSAMDFVFLHVALQLAPPVYDREATSFLEREPDAPGSIYFRILNGESIEDVDAVLQHHPEFAELWAYRGQQLLGDKRYRPALEALNRAWELVPDYLPILDLLGSTYLYDLRFPEPALRYYTEALRIFPREAEASLGRGVALHYLGRRSESNEILRAFFDDAIDWTGTRVPARKAYMGRAAYFIAYNDLLSGLATPARLWVNRSLELLPNLEGARYLSGVLYFGEHDFRRATDELRQVVEPGTTICDAYFKMGMIQAQEDPSDRGPYFLSNGICLERKLAAGLQRIGQLGRWDLDPDIRTRMLESARRDLSEAKSAALASAVSMLNTTQDIFGPSGSTLVDALERLFDRLEAAPVH